MAIIRVGIKPIVAGLCISGLSVLASLNIDGNNKSSLKEDALSRVLQIKSKIESRISARFAVAKLVRMHLESTPGAPLEKFQSVSTAVNGNYEDLQAFNWLDAQGVIKIVTPFSGNEAALGLDISSLGHPGEVLRQAKRTGRLQATAPIHLAQGGTGFAAYLPVMRGEALLGYLNLAFVSKKLIGTVVRERSENDYPFEVLDIEAGTYHFKSGSLAHEFTQSQTIQVGGRLWQISASPPLARIGGVQNTLSKIVLVSGVFLSLTVVCLYEVSIRQSSKLRDREERFGLAMRGATEGLFDWNLLTGECYFSPRLLEMLGRDRGDRPKSIDYFWSRVHPSDYPEKLIEEIRGGRSKAELIEEEFRMNVGQGGWKFFLARACIVRDCQVPVRVVGTLVDINDAKERERALEKAAKTDELTELNNRRGLTEEIRSKLGELSEGSCLAIFHVDLDNFKSINDVEGHDAGDRALSITARRLLRHPASLDIVSRVGGDEFLFCKVIPEESNSALSIAEDIISDLNRPFEYAGKLCRVGASVGVAYAGSSDVQEVAEKIANADIALKEAKKMGGNRCTVFRGELREIAELAARMASEIRCALDRGEIGAHFQPQVDAQTGEVVGFEALARWIHPVKGVLSAAEFTNYVSDSYLIREIDRAVFSSVVGFLGILNGIGMSDATVSVNLSTAQLGDPGMANWIMDFSKDNKLPVSRVNFEILESTLLGDRNRHIAENIFSLNRFGFDFVLDDFGTGHSALSSILNFPISRLKVDRSLVSGIEKDRPMQLISRAIVSLGEELGVEVLIEGVETRSELAFFSDAGAKLFQGFFFAKPMPSEKVADWLWMCSSGKDAKFSVRNADSRRS